MISLSELNPQQRKAAETISGPVLILAGAGSGKTRTLTYRIAHMVGSLSLPPQQILGVSFTNRAAREMRERVKSLLGPSKSRQLTLTTFHSLGVKILKKEIDQLGYHSSFTIYDTSDQLAIVREALKHYHAEKKFDQKQILSKIGYLKNLGFSADEWSASTLFNEEDPYDIATDYVYRFYQDKLKFYNAIDFDDILLLTVKLFKKFPKMAQKYSEKYQYIMIDEYQDTNALQFQLLLSLTSTHNNLCVVGDDDQSIYAFRGADISNILSFEKYFPKAKIIKLEQNYRSTTPILNLANHVIKENKNRRKKTLWSNNPSEWKPHLWAMADTDHESQVIADEITKHQANGGYLGDMAILYRSNTQTRPLEDELRLSQIPYTIIGGQKFYEKKEVKDLIAYLSLCLNDRDQIALRRILNVPHRGIGMVTLQKYIERSQELQLSLFEVMEKEPQVAGTRTENIQKFTKLIRQTQYDFQNNSLGEAINQLIKKTDYLTFIEKSYHSAKQIERRKNDIELFIDSANRFERFYKNLANLKTFVERLLLQDSQDNNEEDNDVRKNCVTMMTLHSSKGLEFNTVYLLGFEEETLPHKKTIINGEDISEERRLAYVGITRAREKLYLTYCKERKIHGRQIPRFKSRFLHGLEHLLVEQDRTTFNHMTKEEAVQYKSNFFANLADTLKDLEN